MATSKEKKVFATETNTKREKQIFAFYITTKLPFVMKQNGQ
jgi:hypothetical protein